MIIIIGDDRPELSSIKKMLRGIMATQEETLLDIQTLTGTVNGMKVQLDKVYAEVNNATIVLQSTIDAQENTIAALQAEIAAGNVSPALSAAVTTLKEVVSNANVVISALDELNPDQV